MLLTITLATASLACASPTPIAAPTAITATAGEDQKTNDDLGESVRIVTQDKVSISGSYFAPRTRGNAKVPGAILVHDAGSSRAALAEMAVYLQRKGFGVLTLDLRGHGESTSADLDWSKMEDKAKESTWAFAGRDLSAAGSYLLGRKEIHAANLSLVGVGAGGALALRHATDDDATRAVVLVGPPGEALGFDMTDGVRNLGGLPCLIVADKDGRKKAETMRDAGHGANDNYEYVTVQVMKSAADELLADKRLNSSFSKWLTDEVMDKDG
ncbi:MAG: alpha/beta hydrolase [Planctomycetota bacterium]|nr:alpha/beta hydrolase [Planctomycetota bacterium]